MLLVFNLSAGRHGVGLAGGALQRCDVEPWSFRSLCRNLWQLNRHSDLYVDIYGRHHLGDFIAYHHNHRIRPD
jgi:hypothetical protein